MLWRTARDGLGIRDVEHSHITLHDDRDEGLYLTLYGRDDQGNASLIANARGQVTERRPRTTASGATNGG
ncbi:hypothetical protein AB0F42_08730 [Streptomyces buecherae]|uniref:hypothetical protein n=1 Tax=Streptomyces buecherae TaxID=2763006 RepID=UPI00340B2E5D